MDAGGQLCPCVNVVLLRGQLFYSELSILLTTKFKRYPVFTVWYRRFNVCLTTGQMVVFGFPKCYCAPSVV